MLEAHSNHGNRPKVQPIYKEGDSLLTHAKKANITSTPHLEPNRNTMQKPIEGLSPLPVSSFKKSRGGEPQKNIPIFAIHFKVTTEIAIVSRRSKLEHEMAQKQKIPKVARPKGFRKYSRQRTLQIPMCREHANRKRHVPPEIPLFPKP
jgi:hypothetical protein